MNADEEFTLSSKSKSISLTAKEDVAVIADKDVQLLAKANLSAKGRHSFVEGQVEVHVKSPKNKLN